MLLLKVDEAYAFDYLSILFVKKELSDKNKQNWNLCYDFIKSQINDEALWEKIINSEEFKEMITANKITFDAVAKAKNNEVTAQYVDKCNFLRHSAKENFQKEFFNSDLQEQKIGYEKYK
jgi:hypothetical protein